MRRDQRRFFKSDSLFFKIRHVYLFSGATLFILSYPFTANPAEAEVVAQAFSPNGRITMSLNLDNEGRPSYAIKRDGKPLINESRLGFMFTDAPKIERNLALTGIQTAKSDTTWTQPWGEWSSIRDHHNEIRIILREKGDLQREMDVTFRLFDDGVAFRYTLPDQSNLHHANIAEELTQFAFAESGTAWWKPAFEWNREEYLYNKTPLDAVGTAQTVMTVKLDSGAHVALHEAALVDYAGMNLARSEGNTFRAVLTPGSGAPKVSRDAGFSTPWRTIAIADDAAGLYMNHMILNLNEPNKLGDVSGWIKPGKFVGVWWNMIKGDWTWARGPKHGAATENVRRYIDFASANGFSGVLVEGWNVGWDGNWFGNGNEMNFSQPTDDFDAASLAAYAHSKGVRLVGHHETGGSASHYDDQLESAFKWAADHGEQIVKTGYVTDAGQIERVDPDGSKHREWHEGQWMVNHYLRVVQAASKYKVSIDSHEPVKDTGLRRTYPNWITREGGRGMEYNAWIGGKNPPEHEANLVFTQMLGGPMDFTPGVLSLTGSEGSAIQSTIAKQLALYVVLYSPFVMAADTPENYANYPGPFKFIKDVPTDWADSLVLNGAVGDFVTIARKSKSNGEWYIGSIGDEEARSYRINLSFLDKDQNYMAEIYRDGSDSDYRSEKRKSIIIEKKLVKYGDIMDIKLAPGGGQAIRIYRR